MDSPGWVGAPPTLKRTIIVRRAMGLPTKTQRSGTSVPPRGVWVSAGFFACGGLLEIGTAVWELPRPLTFWPVWEAFGRGLLNLLLAVGLWERIGFCRSIAMVYCLAALATYAVVLALAFANAPVRFPPSVVLESLYEIPSCAILLPYLRSPAAALLFTRSLFGR